MVIPYERKQCVVVPQEGTYDIQNRIFAYKVVDGKAVSTPIQVYELKNGSEYIVEEGLKIGDVIVAEGAGLLKEGTLVQSPVADESEKKEESL